MSPQKMNQKTKSKKKEEIIKEAKSDRPELEVACAMITAVVDQSIRTILENCLILQNK